MGLGKWPTKFEDVRKLSIGHKAPNMIWKAAGIALVLQFLGATLLAIGIGIAEGGFESLLILPFAPFILMLFGWFWFPLIFLCVALMWACCSRKVVSSKIERRGFLVLATLCGALPFFVFGIVHPAIDPFLTGFCGYLGGLMIIKVKRFKGEIPTSLDGQ